MAIHKISDTTLRTIKAGTDTIDGKGRLDIA